MTQIVAVCTICSEKSNISERNEGLNSSRNLQLASQEAKCEHVCACTQMCRQRFVIFRFFAHLYQPALSFTLVSMLDFRLITA